MSFICCFYIYLFTQSFQKIERRWTEFFNILFTSPLFSLPKTPRSPRFHPRPPPHNFSGDKYCVAFRRYTAILNKHSKYRHLRHLISYTSRCTFLTRAAFSPHQSLMRSVHYMRCNISPPHPGFRISSIASCPRLCYTSPHY